MVRLSVRNYFIERKINVDHDYQENDFNQQVINKLGMNKEVGRIVFSQMQTNGFISIDEFCNRITEYRTDKDKAKIKEKKQKEKGDLKRMAEEFIIEKDNKILQETVNKLEREGTPLITSLLHFRPAANGNRNFKLNCFSIHYCAGI